MTDAGPPNSRRRRRAEARAAAARRLRARLARLGDRTVVLALGLVVGAVLMRSFQDERPEPAQRPGILARAPAPIVAANVHVCAAPYASNLLASISASRPVRIGVFGDSFGDGIWSGLLRLLPAQAGFEVHRFSKQATGFTRYTSLNLEQTAAEQLRQQPIDIAVINFGANDAQPIYEHRKLLAYMGPEWKRTVSTRVTGLVTLLRRQGAAVFWVGLPRMRRPEFDAEIQQMNGFYADEMSRLQVPYTPTEALSIDAQGRYADYLADAQGQEPRLMRAGDGVHMSMQGYVHLVRPLAADIRSYVGDAQRFQVSSQ